MGYQKTPEVQAARDRGERAQRRRKVHPQKQISERIPEQIVERGILQERILERIPEQIVEHGIPQERITERTPEHIVGHGIPQERTSERIPKQIVGRGIHQEQISERIVEQIVAVPDLHSIPQEQTSERIQEPIVDAERGTSSSAAVRLDTAECPIDGVFSHFSPKEKKRDDQARVECEPGGALELIHAASL